MAPTFTPPVVAEVPPIFEAGTPQAQANPLGQRLMRFYPTRERGTAAALDYGERFDGVRPASVRVPSSVGRTSNGYEMPAAALAALMAAISTESSAGCGVCCDVSSIGYLSWLSNQITEPIGPS